MPGCMYLIKIRQLDYDTGLPMEKATRMKTTKDEKN